MAQVSSRFDSGVGFSYGMGRVGAEVAAAVGAELLDRDDAGGDAAGDGLLGALDGGRLGRSLEGHRRALPHQQDGDDERQRQEQPHRRPGHVDVEVADGRQAVAGQRPDRRHRRRHAGGRGDELQERDDEHLRQVRQAGLAAVVLQVGVGDEARDGVEGQRRLHVGDAVGVERQHCLERDDGERHQPHHHVRGEQRDRVALPVLLGGGVDAGDAQDESFDRPEDGIEPGPAAREHVGHVLAEQRARADGDQDGQDDGGVFGLHGVYPPRSR